MSAAEGGVVSAESIGVCGFGSAQSRAVLAVNTEQIRLYHAIGLEILARQDRQGWGTNIINRLSADRREAFPDMKGLSARNLQYMRRFAKEYPDLEFVQQPAAKLAWFHIAIRSDL